jgi:RNA polymerase sigma factor (sigma-70 family)
MIPSDDRLARRAVGGDERAFAAIYRRYHQSLYRFCLAIVGNPQDAQDALQNTMLKALRALPGEERRIELKPWLYRIAHNESINLLRRRRETRELDAELPARGPGLAEEAAVRERLRHLFADLEELPERQRETLVMRELAGLDFAEIGAALGTSAAVARQTLYEARLSLRQMDEGRGMSCDAVSRALSDGDGRVIRRRDVRSHLRTCASCRRFQEEIQGRRRDFAAISPLPAVAAAGLLQGLLGSSSGSGGGLAAALGGGAAKSAGVSAALKGAATVAVVAAVGVTAADRGGIVDTPLPGGDGPSQVTRTEGTESGGSASAASEAVSDAARLRAAKAIGSGIGAAAGAKTGAGQAGANEVGGAGVGTTAAGDSSPGTDASAHGNGQASEHPHGRGHEKSHPVASTHGQQIAAAHQGATNGAAGAKGGSSPPANPPHPAHPSNPSGEQGGSASPPKNGGSAPAEVGEQATPVSPPPVEEDIVGHPAR